MLGIFLEILVLVFTEYIYVLCFEKMYSKKANLKLFHIILFVFFAIILYINNFFSSVLFKISMSLLILIIINKMVFKNNFRTTLLTSGVLCIISLIFELFIVYLFSGMFHNFEELNSYYVPKICISLLLTSVTYCFVYLTKYHLKIKSLISFKIEYFLFVIIMILNIIVIKYNLDYKNSSSFWANILMIIGLTFLLIVTINAIHKRKIYKIKSDDLSEKVKYYEQIANDFRELKHNLNNDLLTIRTIVNDNAQQIIDEKIQKYNKSYQWLSTLENIPKGLQGLIYIKLNEVPKDQLCIEVDNKIGNNIMSKISPKSYSKLCSALGIVIDNAIQGAIKSVDKVIYIGIEEDVATPKNINIKVINTFSGTINLDKIGKLHYSTKRVKSGIGLNYLQKIQNIEVKQEIFSNLFIVSIKVPEEFK